MKALLDGDLVVFKAGMINEKQCYRVKKLDGTVLDMEHNFTKTQLKKQGYTDDRIKSYKQVKKVSYHLHSAKEIVNRILKEVEADDYIIFIGDEDHSNFRYKLAKTLPYKANRDPKHRPHFEREIRQYLIDNFNTRVVNGMEADDAMSIYQCDDIREYTHLNDLENTEKDKGMCDTIICSADKDMNMVPGWHFDIEHGGKANRKDYMKQAKYFITDPGFLSLRVSKTGRKVLVGGGHLWFLAQLLLGDSTDNIPGFDGVGPVAVYEYLKDVKNYKEGVKSCYCFYLDKLLNDNYTISKVQDRFLEVARLLWILREPLGKGKIFPKEWIEEINSACGY